MSAWPSRRHLVDLILGALVLGLAMASPKLIPYNMDEFLHYHAFGCQHFKLSGSYNTLHEACGQYDLKLPGTSSYLPLRSYAYVGTPQIVPFLPFWAVLRDPVAVRIQGAVYLLVAIGLLACLVGVSWRNSLFAALLFPSFWLSFIIDDGPVGILICDLLLLMLLIRRALVDDGAWHKVRAGVLIGLLAFVGVWVKLLFVWVMPALMVWALWLTAPPTIRDWPATLKRQWLLLASASLACVSPLLVLLAAVDRSGQSYSAVASQGGSSLAPGDVLAQALRLGRLVVNSSAFYDRGMYIPRLWGSRLADVIPAAVAVCALGVGIWRGSRRERSWVVMLLGLAALTLAIMCTNPNAWAPHHLVFSLVFAVAAIAVCAMILARQRALLLVLVGVSGLYTLSLLLRLPHADISRDANFDKDRLTAFLRTSHLDAATVQFHADWGSYYISNVFGDRQQLVLFRPYFLDEPLDERRQDLRRVRDIATELQRDVLVIAWSRPVGTERDVAVLEVLGQPSASYSFNSWVIYRYRFQTVSSTK